MEKESSKVEEKKKFSYPPQLLLVDGGKGQLSVAQKVVDKLGLSDLIFVASLAKQFEDVYVSGKNLPVSIPRNSEALYMLQRLRDESHRFAVEYHRKLRSKRMTSSVLDGIPGLGERRKRPNAKNLRFGHFFTYQKMRNKNGNRRIKSA